MFAVVRTGGKQYRVAPGDKIVVEKMDGNAGDKIKLGDVLLAGDGGQLKSVDGLNVAAEIIAQAKGEKVTVFKKRRRHNYRRKKGHRQQHTILRIVAIGDHKAEKPAKAGRGRSGARRRRRSSGRPKAPAKSRRPPKRRRPRSRRRAKADKPKAEAKPAAAEGEGQAGVDKKCCTC